MFKFKEKEVKPTLETLALHKQKLQQITNSIDSNQITIICGPPGSSKSTSVKALAHSRNLKIVEYFSNQNIEEFLSGAQLQSANSIILIEDLPNLFYAETVFNFEQALLKYLQEPKSPKLVVCFTEIEVDLESLTVNRTLPTLISQKSVEVIKVNRVNSQLLRKVLTLKIRSNKLKIDPNVLKILCDCGDIRSALNSLDLISRTNKQNAFLRNDKVELFHAIGKILFESKDPMNLIRHISNFNNEIATFNLTLLENYCNARHQQLPISTISQCAELLSFQDLNSEVLGLHSALEIKSLIENSIKINREKKFVPLRFTQYFNVMKTQREYKRKRYLDEEGMHFVRGFLDSDSDEFDML